MVYYIQYFLGGIYGRFYNYKYNNHKYIVKCFYSYCFDDFSRFDMLFFCCIIQKRKEISKKVIIILKGKCEYEVKKEQIRQAFATYLTKNCSYLNIVQLNLRLIEKLQEEQFDNCSYEEIGEFCKTLTDLNNDFNDEHLYNDEKLNALLSITNNELLNEKIKSLFLCINSYYDGRIYEKDCVIQEQKREMEKNKKAKVFSFIVAAVGFLSGIVTLVQAIF